MIFRVKLRILKLFPGDAVQLEHSARFHGQPGLQKRGETRGIQPVSGERERQYRIRGEFFQRQRAEIAEQ